MLFDFRGIGCCVSYAFPCELCVLFPKMLLPPFMRMPLEDRITTILNLSVSSEIGLSFSIIKFLFFKNKDIMMRANLFRVESWL